MSSIKRHATNIIEDGPAQQVVSLIDQQPIGILMMILSYLTFDMNWDSISGVNKKWLITTQRIPNSYVEWYDNDIHYGYSWKNGKWHRCCRGRADNKFSSFGLAIRKYPKVTTLLGFPIRDIETLIRPPLTLHGYNINTLRSLSLVIGNGLGKLGVAVGLVTELYQLLASLGDTPIAAFQSLAIEGNPHDNDDQLRLCYRLAPLLLGPFNKHSDREKHINAVLTTSDGAIVKQKENQQQQVVAPTIRFNGKLPVQCPDEEMNHGWTFTLECPSCSTSIYLCCCLPEDDPNLNYCRDDKSFGYGCDDFPVAASPFLAHPTLLPIHLSMCMNVMLIGMQRLLDVLCKLRW
jgi:hypothetical protein